MANVIRNEFFGRSRHVVVPRASGGKDQVSVEPDRATAILQGLEFDHAMRVAQELNWVMQLAHESGVNVAMDYTVTQ